MNDDFKNLSTLLFITFEAMTDYVLYEFKLCCLQMRNVDILPDRGSPMNISFRKIVKLLLP